MTQSELAAKLQEKLGFTTAPSRISDVPRRGPGKTQKGLRSKHSVQLVPPDGMRKQRLFNFNLRDSQVYREQYLRLREETGLEPLLLRDLAECRLDKSVASLLYYIYRVSLFAQDEIAGIIPEYLTDYVYKVLLPPPDADTFWNINRRRYLNAAKTLRARVISHRRHGNGEIAKSLDEFLLHLRAWGL